MENTYEAGIRFTNECFIKTEYNTESHEVNVTVVTPEATLTGSTTVTAPATRKARSK